MKIRPTLVIALLLMNMLAACVAPPNVMQSLPAATESPLTASAPAPLQTQNGDSQNTVIATLQMNAERAAHTATALPNGAVLLTGGFTASEQVLASAEIFDPATRAFWPTGSMSAARQSHTATLLPNGTVLIAGGFNGEYLASAEVYDPATGSFASAGSMVVARTGHAAVLLANGKVLLAGGTGEGWTFLASAELYDPGTGTFSATGDMTIARESHTATLLASGNVLLTGGHEGRRSAITIYASAELYDEESGTFMPTGQMTIKRHKHDATLLADGRVFITGGADERDSEGAYHSTEIYDSAAGVFVPAGDMHAARYKHTGTSLLLQNGQVLLLGGANAVELFDPETGAFYLVADGMATTRLFATATLVSDGEVLFAGGYGTNVAASAQAWLLGLSPG